MPLKKYYPPRVQITPEQKKFILDNYKLQGVRRIEKISSLSKQTGLSEYQIRKIIEEKNLNKSTSIWNNKEIQILNDYCGFIKIEDVLEKINESNRKNKKKARTLEALKTECYRLGLSIDLKGTYLSGNDLRNIFGITHPKLESWLKDSEISKSLKPINKNETHLIFHRTNIKKFIIEYRNEIVKLKGCKWDLILDLFAD